MAAGSASHLEQSGTVVEFDAKRGLGVVESADGQRLSFHCIQIADGSRSVSVGAAVTYALAPGALGIWEAVAVSPVS